MSDAKKNASYPTRKTVREVVEAVVRECPGYWSRDVDAMAEGWNPADAQQEEAGYVYGEAYARLAEMVDPGADAREASWWDDSDEWLEVCMELSDALWNFFRIYAVSLLPGAWVARETSYGDGYRLLRDALRYRLTADEAGDRLGEDASTRATRAVAVALCNAAEKVVYMQVLDQLQMWKLEGAPAHNALHRALHDHFEAMVEEAEGEVE